MAKKSEGQEWQRNKGLKERNEIMFNQELATDITFKVSSSFGEKAAIVRAHKYILISSSPVFWTMFCGQLKEDGDVVISDVEPDAFKEMLRFIYTEKSTITGDNVMHILHAAKKYDIPALATKCVDFMDKGLDSNNVFTILDHGMFFNEKELSRKCLVQIEEHSHESFHSGAFIEISQATLSFVLESDNLGLTETELFSLCCEWGSVKMKTHATSLRDTLGDALFKIRFPVMDASDFTEIVCPKQILTKDEQLKVFSYLTSSKDKNRPKEFCCTKRDGQCRANVSKEKAASRRKIVVGDRVRAKGSVENPKHGWGKATHQSVCLLKRIAPNGIDKNVKFPEYFRLEW